MENYPKLNRPPIVEALIDINVVIPSGTNLKQLENFHDLVRKDFPKKVERKSIKVSFKQSQKANIQSFSQQNDILGYQFVADDGKKIVQARLDGFTFNKLKPYESWETFFDEAQYHWGDYLRIVRPVKVVRLALRYINRMELPLPFGDFKEYILTVPDVAPGVPSALSNFLMRLEIPDEKSQSLAIITETIEPVSSEAKFLPLIFDIDVARIVDLDANSNDIWKMFELLRDCKNRIFFKSLTPKTLELLQ